MDKIAQKRRALTKLREVINAPTEALMGKLSPQFVELMEQLREVDDNIREQAAELKNLIKLAKTNFNRREYMTAISYIGQFHEKVETIYNELSKLASAVDVKHHEFLFGDVDQENIDYLINKLGPKFDQRKLQRLMGKKPISARASLAKEAGIADWWYNLTTDRGRALAAWEKRFPREAKELKRQTDNMIKKSESLLSVLLETLKTLSSLRATRRLEEYLKVADKFKQKYKGYDATFSIFYDTYVKKFVEMQREIIKKQEEEGKTPGTLPLPTLQKMPEALPFVEEPKPKGPQPLFNKEMLDRIREVRGPLRMDQPPKTVVPPTEHDVGSTIYSPLPLNPEQLKTNVDLEPSTDIFDTEREPVEELHTAPSNGTMVSRQSNLPVKEKPIEVSVAEPNKTPPTPQTLRSKTHQRFLQHLSKLADKPFVMATEMIAYANSIKEEDPQVSQQLLQLSKNILVKG